MPGTQTATVQPGMALRSIFISDLHLGSHFSRCESLAHFLSEHEPEHLYLVGDFIDGWALQRQWHWPDGYRPLFRRIAQLAHQGTRIHYTPGNHDDYLRRNMGRRSSVVIRDEFVHTCVDGTRLLVTHGDQFDDVESRAPWLSRLGAKTYEALLLGDRVIGRLGRTVGCSPPPLSHVLKRGVKRIVGRISGFEQRLAKHARANRCSGVVCGHLHRPQDRMLKETRYINLGDWIENTSALVEHVDGRLQLFHWSGSTSPATENVVTPQVAAIAERLAADLLDDLAVPHPIDLADRGAPWEPERQGQPTADCMFSDCRF